MPRFVQTSQGKDCNHDSRRDAQAGNVDRLAIMSKCFECIGLEHHVHYAMLNPCAGSVYLCGAEVVNPNTDGCERFMKYLQCSSKIKHRRKDRCLRRAEYKYKGNVYCWQHGMIVSGQIEKLKKRGISGMRNYMMSGIKGVTIIR